MRQGDEEFVEFRGEAVEVVADVVGKDFCGARFDVRLVAYGIGADKGRQLVLVHLFRLEKHAFLGHERGEFGAAVNRAVFVAHDEHGGIERLLEIKFEAVEVFHVLRLFHHDGLPAAQHGAAACGGDNRVDGDVRAVEHREVEVAVFGCNGFIGDKVGEAVDVVALFAAQIIYGFERAGLHLAHDVFVADACFLFGRCCVCHGDGERIIGRI